MPASFGSHLCHRTRLALNVVEDDPNSVPPLCHAREKRSGITAMLAGEPDVCVNVEQLLDTGRLLCLKKGVSFSIPESAKPGIYARVRRIVTTDYILVAIGLCVILAILVNVIELLCTAGLPAVYTQILAAQQLPHWKNYLYLSLYIVGYMFDDTLMVIAFLFTLSKRKMHETEGRWLKLVSGVVVLALGFAMLFRPDWLQW